VILTIILQPQNTWWVFISLFILQFVVINVLMPRIMSQSVGLHPLLVFAAVLVGARVGGGWGAIFGVPVAAMLYLLVRAFYQRVIVRMPLYRSGAPLSPDALVPSPVAINGPDVADGPPPPVAGTTPMPPLQAERSRKE
jgi:hypothetical protein